MKFHVISESVNGSQRHYKTYETQEAADKKVTELNEFFLKDFRYGEGRRPNVMVRIEL